MTFIDELKRRNVFRVAIAYVVVAWLVAQVAVLALDSFDAPGWVIKTVLLLLVIGFPVALVFAWAFELTPDGLRRDTQAGSAESDHRRSGRGLDQLIILVLILAVAFFSYDKFLKPDHADQSIDDYLKPGPADQGIDRSKSPDSTVPPDTGNNAQTNVSVTSIAVLPFVNISDDPGNEYFSDGLSEELLNLLARIPELKVAARTSAFAFKDKDVQIVEIAEALKVDHLLEGSVRKSGDRVRITVQLIKAADGYHVFSQSYDRRMEDIFAMQDEIASAVVESFRISLLTERPTVSAVDPEVYSLYLKGRYLNNLKGRENWENAVVALQEALALDSQYAPAWSELSTTYRYQANNGLLDAAAGIRLARDAAHRALSLDPDLASAWINLAQIRSMGDWDWQGAEEALNNARDLEPRSADVLNGIGQHHVIVGRFDDAIEAYQAAIELDPLSQSPVNSLGLAYVYVGEFDNAEATFRSLLELNPRYPWGHTNLATVKLLRGKPREGLEENRLNPPNNLRDVVEILALLSLGDEGQAESAIAAFHDQPTVASPFWWAVIEAWRGDVDSAFALLDRAVDQRDPSVTFILSSPFFRQLEQDMRWSELLTRVGLLEAYETMP